MQLFSAITISKNANKTLKKACSKVAKKYSNYSIVVDSNVGN